MNLGVNQKPIMAIESEALTWRVKSSKYTFDSLLYSCCSRNTNLNNNTYLNNNTSFV